MSTAVLCGERPRKIAIQFKLGKPLPVPRNVARRRVSLPKKPGVLVEIGAVTDPRFGGLQIGRVVTRPPRGGAFSRSLVSAFAKAEAERMRAAATERARVLEERAKEQRETEEAFAYLEGLAELDAYERLTALDAVERTDEELLS